MSESLVTSYCPRCDRSFTSGSKLTANDLVRNHLSMQTDQQHEGALEAWDAQVVDDKMRGM